MEKPYKPGWVDGMGLLFIATVLLASIYNRFFGPPPAAENTYRGMMVRLDEQEAADAQLQGDVQAQWWRDQAKRDAQFPK